jgi:hypothetical protein
MVYHAQWLDGVAALSSRTSIRASNRRGTPAPASCSVLFAATHPHSGSSAPNALQRTKNDRALLHAWTSLHLTICAATGGYRHDRSSRGHWSHRRSTGAMRVRQDLADPQEEDVQNRIPCLASKKRKGASPRAFTPTSATKRRETPEPESARSELGRHFPDSCLFVDRHLQQCTWALSASIGVSDPAAIRRLHARGTTAEVFSGVRALSRRMNWERGPPDRLLSPVPTALCDRNHDRTRGCFRHLHQPYRRSATGLDRRDLHSALNHRHSCRW